MNVRMNACVDGMRSPWQARRQLTRLAGFLLLAAVLLTGCNYVVLGDSLGSPNRTTYATDVATMLHVQPTDLAVDGETLPVFEQRLLQDQAMRDAIAHADFVTLSIGSNDMMGYLIQYSFGDCDKGCIEGEIQGFEAAYARTIGELRALTHARIVVLDIYDPQPGMVDKYVLGQLASVDAFIHKTVCGQGALVAWVADAFNGPDWTRNPVAAGYIGDIIHPSALGAQVIAQAVMEAHC